MRQSLASLAEQSGVALVTVHGRTRNQFYKGKADWSAIKAVADAVSIPLIANGDVLDEKDAPEILRQSGADGLMIGRGAYGRPWLPGYIAHYLQTGKRQNAPEGDALLALVTEHYDRMIDYYPDVVGVRCARKHLGWYMDYVSEQKDLRGPLAAQMRKTILTADDPNDVRARLRDFFGVAAERQVA